MTWILGISAYYHDSAAALLRDGEIVAAAQEERFTRRKHDPRFPHDAITAVLDHAGIALGDVDHVVYYEKPRLKFDRLVQTYLATAPRGFNTFRLAMPVWLREKLFLNRLLTRELRGLDPGFDPGRLHSTEHHFSHAASAFYPSPFEDATVLTLDGVGEWTTTSVALGQGNRLTMEKELRFPHSLGLLYSAVTYYTGFKVNSGEYKVMGLAPYGTPRFAERMMTELVDIKPDGTFRLNQAYFNYLTGLTMTNRRFADLFGQPRRDPETGALTQFHMDMAASVQAVTEEIVLRLTRSLAQEYPARNLCLAGGVALNCVANGKVLRDGAFDRVWVQPAAGDAGGALGAALACWHQGLDQPRTVGAGDAMQGAYLGPAYTLDRIERDLRAVGAVFETLDRAAMIDTAADALAQGQALGWFQGRMEFGPRALGNRSILGDPRSDQTQKTLNLKVKYRESFRPFAPSVLGEQVSDWFDHTGDSPYMLMVANVAADKQVPMTRAQQQLFGIDKLNVRRSQVPAITHVDYSARLQTVHADTNPDYHALITAFQARTGCPMVVNTSFNVRGEPIVCSPLQAFHCFMGTGLDMLVLGNCVLRKQDQPTELRLDYKNLYELD